MPAKKRPARPKAPPADASGPAWLVILEDIRSQNRLTIETVDARHEEMRRELQNFRGEVRADISALRTIAQGQSIDIRDLKTGLARVEAKVQNVETRVENIETRVENTETRVQNIETKVGNIETRVQNIETKVGNIETKVDQLGAIEARVATLERRRA
jgi:chromosome segregation ATPase